MVTSTPSTISCAAWGFAPDSDGCTNREADSSLTSATEDQAPSSTPAHGFRQSEASAKQSRFTGVHWHEASSSWGFRLQAATILHPHTAQVEQQIVEIDKLNSIINSMETEMLKLKKQYAQQRA